MLQHPPQCQSCTPPLSPKCCIQLASWFWPHLFMLLVLLYPGYIHHIIATPDGVSSDLFLNRFTNHLGSPKPLANELNIFSRPLIPSHPSRSLYALHSSMTKFPRPIIRPRRQTFDTLISQSRLSRPAIHLLLLIRTHLIDRRVKRVGCLVWRLEVVWRLM